MQFTSGLVSYQGSITNFLEKDVNPENINLHDIVAHGGSVDDIKKLLEKGAPVDCLNTSGETFLLTHCKLNGNPALAILALQHGADIQHPSYDRISINRDTLHEQICVPLCCFADSLSKIVDVEYEDRFNGTRTTYKHEYRQLSPFAVGLLLEEFLSKGAKFDDTSRFKIKKWMELSESSTPYLTQLTKTTCTEILKCIFSCDMCCSKADCDPKRWNKKVCAAYTTSATLIIAGLAVGIWGIVTDDRVFAGIGGAVDLLTAGIFAFYLKKRKSPDDQLISSSSRNYGSTYV